MGKSHSDKLKSLLDAKYITQTALAEIMNVSSATMHHRINNVGKFKLDELYALANALNMNIVDLIKYLEK